MADLMKTPRVWGKANNRRLRQNRHKHTLYPLHHRQNSDLRPRLQRSHGARGPHFPTLNT